MKKHSKHRVRHQAKNSLMPTPNFKRPLFRPEIRFDMEVDAYSGLIVYFAPSNFPQPSHYQMTLDIYIAES